MHPHHNTQECFSVIETFKRAFFSNNGFAGYTHAVTGVLALAILFLLEAQFGWVATTIFGGIPAIVVIAGFCIALIGATLLPDLDNTRSTSQSAFGGVGVVVSILFRASSTVIQTLIRTKKDDPTPNPHRGFWHSTVGAALIGAIVWGLTLFPQSFTLPGVGEVTLGWIFAFLVFGGMMHLFLTVFAKSAMKKAKSSPVAGELIAFVISAILAIAIFWFVPREDFLWLAIAIALGSFVHILGDTFTKMGTPIFFPLTVFTKKRFWWYTRFAMLESGSDFEKILSSIMLVASVIIAGIAAWIMIAG